MKNRVHKSLDRLLDDKYVGTKISLFLPIEGDAPEHMLFTGLRDSAIRLLPDEHVANSFRRWMQMIRDNPWTAIAVATGVGAAISASGADKKAVTAAAEAAKDGCPISRALAGNVALSVEATLETDD